MDLAGRLHGAVEPAGQLTPDNCPRMKSLRSRRSTDRTLPSEGRNSCPTHRAKRVPFSGLEKVVEFCFGVFIVPS